MINIKIKNLFNLKIRDGVCFFLFLFFFQFDCVNACVCVCVCVFMCVCLCVCVCLCACHFTFIFFFVLISHDTRCRGCHPVSVGLCVQRHVNVFPCSVSPVLYLSALCYGRATTVSHRYVYIQSVFWIYIQKCILDLYTKCILDLYTKCILEKQNV